MTGVAVEKKMGEQGDGCCIACICSLINCIKIYRPRRRNLKMVVAKRLKAAADAGKIL